MRSRTVFALVVSLAVGCFAQTNKRAESVGMAQSPRVPIAERATVVRQTPRFLGWKYAASHPSPGIRNLANAQRQSSSGDKKAVGFQPSNSYRPSNSPASANAGFGLLPGLPAGFIPTAVVAGDFNADAHMDAAISNGGDNTVYVLAGKGDGTFDVAEILFTQGLSPVWIAATALRQNGPLDLAVVDADSGVLEVFPGNGDGTFGLSVQTALLPQTPTFLIAGDFNGDGRQDLAVGLTVDRFSNEPQFEILLGNGAGGFSGVLLPPPFYNHSDSPIPTGWIAANDLNNDGTPDVVLTVNGGFAVTYVNQAGAAFTQGQPFGPYYAPMVVELGDFDEDGCADAAEADVAGFLTIASGTCDGNFTQTASIGDLGDIDPAMKVADVNGDGHLDVIASAGYYGIGGLGAGNEAGYLVSVIKGDGTGNFGPTAIYRGGTGEYSLALADFNGDNKPEILTVDSFENQATLFINDGTGNFNAPSGVTVGYPVGDPINAPITGTPLLSGDLNGDGHPDLLLSELGQYSNLPSQFTALLNDGAGKFLPARRSPISVGPVNPYPEFTLGAFRNPLSPDIVYFNKYTSNNVVAFFPGGGNGLFGNPTTLATLRNPLKVAAGDFNGDGKLDFAIVGMDDTRTTWEFDVFLGNGTGAFTHLPEQVFPIINLGSPYQFKALDLNHDGTVDLLIGNNDNGGLTSDADDLIELLGNGNGTFQAPRTLLPHFGAVAIADVNGDGYFDLVQGRNPAIDLSQGLLLPVGLTIYLGAPDGTFDQEPSYDLPGIGLPTLEPVLAGDFNGDGITDLAIRYFNDVSFGTIEASLRILQGNGDGTFTVTDHTYQLQTMSDPSIGMDFNGDGRDDLVELTGFTSSLHTIPASQGPTLDIFLDSNPLFGVNGAATVMLDRPALASEDVTLSASDAAIQLPASVHFNPGEQVQHFTFVLGASFATTHVFALYATLGGETATAYGSAPNPNAGVGVTASVLDDVYAPIVDEVGITPGGSVPLIFQVQSIAGYKGTFTSFQCSGLPAGASCTFNPSSARLYPGSRTPVTFEVAASDSTPFGSYSVSITGSDGFLVPQAGFPLGIGDFSLSLSPSTIPVGPTGAAIPILASHATNGVQTWITLSCSGMPAGATCTPSSPMPPNGGTAQVDLQFSGLTPGDYRFEVDGNIASDYHQANGILRVGDFSAALDKNNATISPGGSANFTITLTSINHYASGISVLCNVPDNSLTCLTSPTGFTTLPDGGHATVQLTITAATHAAVVGHSGRFNYAFWSIFLLGMVGVVGGRKKRSLHIAAAGLILLACFSCGGGSSGSGSKGGTVGQTFQVQVSAQAELTQGDVNNQKALGPITITVK